MPKRIRPRLFNENSLNHSKLRRKWKTWLPHLKDDLADLLRKKEIFWDLQKIAEENQKVLAPNTFFDWMCRNYIVAVCVGIRRFADQDKRSRSLWRMLFEILENPGVINRRYFLALGYNKSTKVRASEIAFDKIVGPDKDVLTQAQVRSDLRKIEDYTERIRRFTNKRIAHFSNPGSIKRLPIFDELDTALKSLDDTICKYNVLLAAEALNSLHAIHQYNWTEVLESPWILPGSKFSTEI